MWRREVRDRLFASTTRRFQVLRCPSCALEFQAPPNAPDEIAGFYPPGYWVGIPRDESPLDVFSRATEGYRRLVLHDHAHFVRHIVEEQKSRGHWRGLLDVGCGDGSVLSALRVRPAAGLDWSSEAVQAVRARGFPAVRGELERSPFRAGAFSLVTMFHYLEHVSPARPSLEAVRRLLTPDGRLVVQVPNVDSWQCALLRSRWAGYDPPRHLIHYSTTTLRHTLVRHGFEVVRVTHASLRDNPTTLANSLAPDLYPPARAARNRNRSAGASRWGPSLLYLALVVAVLPFALIEGACGHGAAVMMEARP